MMKRGTDLKFKFRDLKTRLGMRDWQVKGILQSMWDFTAENAMAGNIGRFTNEQIALGIDYEGDADKLVAALIITKWLEEDSEHRIVVHDWHDHCEEWIKKRCLRAGIEIPAASGGHRLPLSASGRLPGPGPGPGPGPKKNPPTPRKEKPLAVDKWEVVRVWYEQVAASGIVILGERWPAIWATWVTHRREIKKPLKGGQHLKAMVKKLVEWGPDRAIAAIEYTVEKGWQGLREPEENRSQAGRIHDDRDAEDIKYHGGRAEKRQA